MKQRGFRYCSACNTKLQKWGKTNAGSRRWRCPNCTGTQVRKRSYLSRQLLLERFVAWLLGKASQTELGMPDRTWRAQTAWCWGVIPKPVSTGEVHHTVILDGIMSAHWSASLPGVGLGRKCNAVCSMSGSMSEAS
jgi:predicted RNA-binding Zn-ribbon protein involved in translation (DUF1610 family)